MMNYVPELIGGAGEVDGQARRWRWMPRSSRELPAEVAAHFFENASSHLYGKTRTKFALLAA
jgi:hypothetical protein